MDFTDVVLKRRMVRHFTSEAVAPEVIERVIEMARHAPSAGFTQGQAFVVVTQSQLKHAIARICGEESYVEGGFHSFISEAPVVVIPCTSEAAYHRRYQEPDKINDDGTEISWPIPFWHMDAGCAVMILLLAVVNEGLSAGFVGIPTVQGIEVLRELLGIPEEVTPVGVIPIGHRAPDVPSPSLKRGRKSGSEYIHSEKW
ncbi:MAG TPA: nitroreductase family protein [Ktedonobacteraceae bacterium]